MSRRAAVLWARLKSHPAAHAVVTEIAAAVVQGVLDAVFDRLESRRARKP